MAGASDKDASRAPSCGGLLGTSHVEETPGWTQNLLEGLHISSGLGTPWDPPGGDGKLQGRRMTGIPCSACCYCDPSPDKLPLIPLNSMNG